MKRIRTLAAAALLGLASLPASADVINVAGGSINLPNGFNADMAAVFHNIINGTGQTLAGVGRVDQINFSATTGYCSSACELTFAFSGFNVNSFSSGAFTATGGNIDFYLGFGSQVNFNPAGSSGSAADLAAATDGTAFLNLVGHTLGGVTLSGNVSQNNLLGTYNISFAGVADVGPGAGVANFNFNTNTQAGGSDVLLTSSANYTAGQPHPSECTSGITSTGAECVWGTASLTASVIPEPSSIALLGVALSGLGFGLRRRNKKSA